MENLKDPFFGYLEAERQSLLKEAYSAPREPKEYFRNTKVFLPETLVPELALQDALMLRRSSRAYSKDRPMSRDQLATVLRWSFGMSKENHRLHPSGGGRYPLEIYPIIFNVQGLISGVYHYHVQNNALEHLHLINEKDIKNVVSSLEPFTQGANALFLFAFIKTRSMDKYGSLAYKLGMIEAGHASQNVYLLSGALGIGCCALGLSKPAELNKILLVDGINESVFYGMAIGAVEGTLSTS